MIRLTSPLLINLNHRVAGDVVVVDEDRARLLVEGGYATYHVPAAGKVETAALKGAPRRAVEVDGKAD
jgi:hypothetical protein